VPFQNSWSEQNLLTYWLEAPAIFKSPIQHLL